MSEEPSVQTLIISRLDRIEGKTDLLVTEVAALKVKSGVWGALSGMVTALVVWLASVMR